MGGPGGKVMADGNCKHPLEDLVDPCLAPEIYSEKARKFAEGPL